MLSHTQEIDQVFHFNPNESEPTLTIYVESGEWNNEQAMNWLAQKLIFYQSAITSGRAFESGIYKRYPRNPIEIISRDPVPTHAQWALYKVAEELEKINIFLKYRYDPDIWDK